MPYSQGLPNNPYPEPNQPNSLVSPRKMGGQCQNDLKYVSMLASQLYRSPNIVRVIKSRRLRWAGHVARMEEGRSDFNILTGTPAFRKAQAQMRGQYYIRMDLIEIGIHSRNQVNSAQDKDYWRSPVIAAMNLRVP